MEIQPSTDVITEEILFHQNAILHLQRSNSEMNEFDPLDSDFILAIQENLEIIKQKELRISLLKDMLPKESLNHLKSDLDDGIDL